MPFAGAELVSLFDDPESLLEAPESPFDEDESLFDEPESPFDEDESPPPLSAPSLRPAFAEP